jgi:hypothetical protein
LTTSAGLDTYVAAAVDVATPETTFRDYQLEKAQEIRK